MIVVVAVLFGLLCPLAFSIDDDISDDDGDYEMILYECNFGHIWFIIQIYYGERDIFWREKPYLFKVDFGPSFVFCSSSIYIKCMLNDEISSTAHKPEYNIQRIESMITNNKVVPGRGKEHQ